MNPLFSCLLAGLYKMSTDVEVAFFPFPLMLYTAQRNFACDSPFFLVYSNHTSQQQRDVQFTLLATHRVNQGGLFPEKNMH